LNGKEVELPEIKKEVIEIYVLKEGEEIDN